jgi:outer membrane protein assembly factor BamB
MFFKRVSGKSQQVPVLIAIISLISILSSTAPATEVGFVPEDIGGGQWVYHYMLTNDTLADPIEQFIIWFEPWLYENLSIVSDPHIGYDWYQDTVEPDPVWLYYGAYRALAWDEGIPVGDSESGFAVRFTYLGEGTPGPQEFDIVDPNEYISLEAGWTTPVLWVDAAAAGNPVQIGTPANPFATIQDAIDAATDDYTIIVLPGSYVEHISFDGKAVTVRSSEPGDWDVVTSTIIDGNFTAGSCVVFDQGEGPDSVLDGFTLTNGKGTEVVPYGLCGGGILCLDTSPTIQHCNITNNGFRLAGHEPWVNFGGGIALLENCQANIINCFITYNAVVGFGADRGSGIAIRSSTPQQAASTIRNCTIANNIFAGWEDIKYYQLDCRDTRPVITNTIIYDDYHKSLIISDPNLVTYSCISRAYTYEGGYANAQLYDLTTSGGNINRGPGYVNDPGYYDYHEELEPPESDFHIKPQSPCVNAGDPCLSGAGQTDIDGQPRVIGARLDIGADEVVPVIIVTKPEGGEVWVSESIHTVTCANYGTIDTVDISYSTNNGADWITLEAGLADSGSYQWQLPAVDSDQCLISVKACYESEDIEPSLSGVFTIHPSPPGPPVSSRWPTLGNDSQRSGLSSDLGPEIGCVKWRFEAGGPVYNSVTIGADDKVHIACEDGRIYTADPNTGEQIWVYDPNSPLLSSPTVGPDGTIYVGCDNGKLYAIDKDGSLRWTHSTDGFIYSTPAVADDGTVFVGAQDGALYALGADGSELWSFETAGPGLVGGAILASPAIGSDGTVYVMGVYDPNLYAIDPCDGSIKWVCDSMAGDGAFASPVVGADGTIYISMLHDPNLYAIEPNEGTIIWARDLADAASGWFGADYEENYPDVSCWSEPALGPDGTIYMSFDDPYLRAVNPDGSIKWIRRIGVIGGFTLAVGNDGLVYAACEDKSLYVVDQTGEELARFDGEDWLSQPVITADSTIIVSDANNAVWAIEIDGCDGQIAALHRPGDVNADWAVDTGDLVLVAISWLEYDDQNWYLTADANRDLYINLADVAVLANWWLIEE